MLKIETKKIWELIKKDSKIQKELEKYIHDEKEKFLEAEAIYFSQRAHIEELQTQMEQVKKKEQNLDDQITEKHGSISILEIKKMFAEIHLKRLTHLMQKATSAKKMRKYQRLVEREAERITHLKNEQDHLVKEIGVIESEKNLLQGQRKKIKREMSQSYSTLESDEKTMNYWAQEVKTKTDRFYQETFEEVSQNFKPCQDLVVPDLEKKKKMPKEEAKEKANPILIDEEYLLSSPEHEKVRRLTKEEQEYYRHVS